MTKAETRKIQVRWKDKKRTTREERAILIMGAIQELRRLQELFKSSDHEMAPYLVDVFKLFETGRIKSLRKL